MVRGRTRRETGAVSTSGCLAACPSRPGSRASDGSRNNHDQGGTLLTMKRVERSPIRWLLLTVLAGALLAALAPTAEAAAPRLTPITTHMHSTLPQPIDQRCPAVPGAVQSYALKGGTVHGDDPADNWVGTDRWTGCFYAFPDGSLKSVGTGHFTGRFGFCGTGQVTYSYLALLSAPRADGSRHDDTTVVVHPFSGTGGLTGVIGGTIDIDGHVSPQLTETAVARGTILC